MTRVSTNSPWTEGNVEFLLANTGTMTDGRLAGELTRITGHEFTRVCVQLKRLSLGIRKEKGPGVCRLAGCGTSRLENEYIRENAHHYTDREMAAGLSRLLGRAVSRKAVKHRRQRMGIETSEWQRKGWTKWVTRSRGFRWDVEEK